ncbi:hypothetical protein GOP47_0000684 [Adiantum capillus-veneris]|uniref:tRNA (guanine-N(7)-)-methyltransferase non-catalytic subunit n=1 Tax=Adiantum capillus-veneris TaxID=13818 RepID=A0A9D4VEE3_ADICA|nr:hypothetical protein GOP47_0000684 [Adiantum capillus-veneris]
MKGKCQVDVKYPSAQSRHEEAIRTITFSGEGKLFVSAGDDKHVKLWDTETWQCTKTVHASKKVSATAFSCDSKWLLYADKFGVVYAMSTKLQGEGLASSVVLDQPVNLLAHCCSIITSLKCTADGKFIVTADRDFKIRVSVFPKDPLQGAHEIEGFCLGHTSFVSCIACIDVGLKSQLLVSGGGDGTVRLWEIETATLLDTVDVRDEVGIADGNFESDAVIQASAITCVCVSCDGSLIAVGVESLDGVLFLKCDLKSKRLMLLQKLVLAEHFCPTSMQFDKNGWLWLVAGAAQKTDSCKENAVTWVKVVSSSLDDTPVFTPVELESIPGGSLLFETLDGTDSDVNKAFALAEAATIAMKNELSKRQYSNEHREFRKRLRNDKKLQRKV